MKMENADIVTGQENEKYNSWINKMGFTKRDLTRNQMERGMEEQWMKVIPNGVLQKKESEEEMA